MSESPQMIGGLRVILNRNLTNTVEDWSRVRSKPRALRRRARGFPQRIRYISVPKPDAFTIGNSIIVMHPETWERLKLIIADRDKEHVASPTWRAQVPCLDLWAYGQGPLFRPANNAFSSTNFMGI